MALICKCCGYKQTDDETIVSMKKRFPNKEVHDIPYYCGACMDNANEDEYDNMTYEMEGDEDIPVIVINTKDGVLKSIYTNIELPEGVAVVIQDEDTDQPLLPTDDMNNIV